jgi:bacteriocin leader peptide (microcyclamide/patellamide family)
MDKQNLMPQAAQPVNRITTGQLPAQLAELWEEALRLHDINSTSVLRVSIQNGQNSGAGGCYCSYDGDDAE